MLESLNFIQWSMLAHIKLKDFSFEDYSVERNICVKNLLQNITQNLHEQTGIIFLVFISRLSVRKFQPKTQPINFLPHFAMIEIMNKRFHEHIIYEMKKNDFVLRKLYCTRKLNQTRKKIVYLCDPKPGGLFKFHE